MVEKFKTLNTVNNTIQNTLKNTKKNNGILNVSTTLPKKNNISRTAANNVSRTAANNVSRTAANNVSRPAANNVSRPAANNVSRTAANNVSRTAANNISRTAANNVSRTAANNVNSIIKSRLSDDNNLNKIIKPSVYTRLKEYKTIIITVIVILLIIILVVTGYFMYKKYIINKKINQKLLFENQKSTKRLRVENSQITPPKNGYDFTISFWIYINDFYEDFNYWRHGFHKGKMLDNVDLEYTDWDILSNDLREQNPGVWLHPNKPILRIAFTIEPDKEYCDIFTTETSCNDKENYCDWDGTHCNFKNKHPKNLYKIDKNLSPDENSTNSTIIQYVDIEIPIKKVVHLSLVLEQKILNIYYNGELLTIKKFLGDPITNKSDMYFNYNKTFKGNFFNWSYIPYEISSNDVKTLSNIVPNIKEVPKKIRVQNNLSKGNLSSALSAAFI